MPAAGYFLRLGGALLLGLVALIIAAILFIILLPVLIPVFIGGLFLVQGFIVLWGVVYIAMMVGVGIYYFFKPMKIEEKDKRYAIEGAKESGMRQKGKSKKNSSG